MLKPNLRRTLKPTLNNCMGSGSSPPSINYVAMTDAISQYWEAETPIVVPDSAAFEISVGFLITVDTGNAWVCIGVGDGFRIAASKNFGAPRGISLTIGGSQVLLNSNAWVYGEYEVVTVTRDVLGNGYVKFKGGEAYFNSTSGFDLYRLCRDGVIGGDDYMGGYVKDLSVSVGGTGAYFVPLTNKLQGATQSATTGVGNFTMLNYTPDVWALENQPPQNTQQASFQQAKAGEESEVGEGSWSGSAPITYTYQWQLDGVDIIGATAKTLLVIAGMMGQSLRCAVTATNQYGSGISITAAIVVTI